MPRRESVMLFGEGKTEAVFLKHLLGLYRDEIQPRVKIDAGQGGSPKQVVQRLIKKHLELAAYDRSLLLLDEDLPLDEIPKTCVRRHRLTVVTSAPQCLEGLFLSLLGDAPPARDRTRSRNLKRRFHRDHLGTDRQSEVVARLRHKCPSLFSRELIASSRRSHPTLESVLGFLGL